MAKVEIKSITMKRNSKASGEILEAGETYKVGEDISYEDAATLVRNKKAIITPDKKKAPKKEPGKEPGKE